MKSIIALAILSIILSILSAKIKQMQIPQTSFIHKSVFYYYHKAFSVIWITESLQLLKQLKKNKKENISPVKWEGMGRYKL